MIDDLVKRLREYGDWPQDVLYREWAEWSHKAADRIEQLERDLAAGIAIDRVRHIKRGTAYTVISRDAELQASDPLHEGQRLVVYRGDDGKFWARPIYEFEDGRFSPAGENPHD